MLRVGNVLKSLAFTALACLVCINIASAQLTFTNPVQINPTSGLDQQGSNIGYIFSVKNSGSSATSNRTLDVTFRPGDIPIFDSTHHCVFTQGGQTQASQTCPNPQGGVAQSNQPVASCPLPSIVAGGTASVTLIVHPTDVPAPGVSANVMDGCNVEATQSGSQPANLVGVGMNDLNVAADVSPNPARIGSPLTYTVTVFNRNDDAAQDVVATLVLPANTTFDKASRSCSRVGDLVTCKIGQLPNDPTITKTVKVTVIPKVCGYAFATAGARQSTPERAMSDNAVGVQVFVNKTSTYTACP